MKTTPERLATLETQMEYVKLAVTNHLPTSINEIDKKVSGLERKIDKINQR